MSTYLIKKDKGYFISNNESLYRQEPYGIVDIGDIMIRESKCSYSVPIRLSYNPLPKCGFLCLFKTDEYHRMEVVIDETDTNKYIHCIPTDDLYTSLILYKEAEGINEYLLLTEEQVEYIKTIIAFKDGRFCFKV